MMQAKYTGAVTSKLSLQRVKLGIFICARRYCTVIGAPVVLAIGRKHKTVLKECLCTAQSAFMSASH